MQTIPEIVEELKTRRDWKSVKEVESKFDDILTAFDDYQLNEFARRKENEDYKCKKIIQEIEKCQERHLQLSFLEPNVPTANEVRKAYSNCINLIVEELE